MKRLQCLIVCLIWLICLSGSCGGQEPPQASGPDRAAARWHGSDGHTYFVSVDDRSSVPILTIGYIDQEGHRIAFQGQLKPPGTHSLLVFRPRQPGELVCEGAFDVRARAVADPGFKMTAEVWEYQPTRISLHIAYLKARVRLNSQDQPVGPPRFSPGPNQSVVLTRSPLPWRITRLVVDDQELRRRAQLAVAPVEQEISRLKGSAQNLEGRWKAVGETLKSQSEQLEVLGQKGQRLGQQVVQIQQAIVQHSQESETLNPLEERIQGARQALQVLSQQPVTQAESIAATRGRLSQLQGQLQRAQQQDPWIQSKRQELSRIANDLSLLQGDAKRSAQEVESTRNQLEPIGQERDRVLTRLERLLEKEAALKRPRVIRKVTVVGPSSGDSQTVFLADAEVDQAFLDRLDAENKDSQQEVAGLQVIVNGLDKGKKRCDQECKMYEGWWKQRVDALSEASHELSNSILGAAAIKAFAELASKGADIYLAGDARGRLITMVTDLADAGFRKAVSKPGELAFKSYDESALREQYRKEYGALLDSPQLAQNLGVLDPSLPLQSAGQEPGLGAIAKKLVLDQVIKLPASVAKDSLSALAKRNDQLNQLSKLRMERISQLKDRHQAMQRLEELQKKVAQVRQSLGGKTNWSDVKAYRDLRSSIRTHQAPYREELRTLSEDLHLNNRAAEEVKDQLDRTAKSAFKDWAKGMFMGLSLDLIKAGISYACDALERSRWTRYFECEFYTKAYFRLFSAAIERSEAVYTKIFEYQQQMLVQSYLQGELARLRTEYLESVLRAQGHWIRDSKPFEAGDGQLELSLQSDGGVWKAFLVAGSVSVPEQGGRFPLRALRNHTPAELTLRLVPR